MPTVTSKAAAVLDAITDGLSARAALAGIQIASGPMRFESSSDSIQFFQVDISQEWGALGRKRREEEGVLKGAVWVMKPGKDEAAVRATRDRAFVLLGEIEDFMRVDPSIGGVVRVSQIRPGVLDQGANEGRWVELDFEIRYEVRLQST